MAYQQFEREVKGDQNGGPEGPPVDILAHGQTATITADVVDFQETVYEALLAHKSGTFGTPEKAGTLILATPLSIRLVIATPNLPLNFPTAYWMDKQEGKSSTNETIHRFTFRALVPSYGGVLCNRTLT